MPQRHGPPLPLHLPLPPPAPSCPSRPHPARLSLRCGSHGPACLHTSGRGGTAVGRPAGVVTHARLGSRRQCVWQAGWMHAAPASAPGVPSAAASSKALEQAHQPRSTQCRNPSWLAGAPTVPLLVLGARWVGQRSGGCVVGAIPAVRNVIAQVLVAALCARVWHREEGGSRGLGRRAAGQPAQGLVRRRAGPAGGRGPLPGRDRSTSQHGTLAPASPTRLTYDADANGPAKQTSKAATIRIQLTAGRSMRKAGSAAGQLPCSPFTLPHLLPVCVSHATSAKICTEGKCVNTT